MAWKKVIVRTIPNSDTAFERMSAEVLAYIKTNYDDTGKRISFSAETSDDGLVQTITSVYENEAARDEFHNDSTILAEASRRNKVNADKGITIEALNEGEEV